MENELIPVPEQFLLDVSDLDEIYILFFHRQRPVPAWTVVSE